MTSEELAVIRNERYKALKSSDNLPSPNGIALRLMELTDSQDAPLKDIIALLNTDPASIGRLLKLANSPIYGRPRPAVAITPDVLLSVGIKTLRQVVLVFSLLANHRQNRCKGFDYDGFWSHSLARGIVCQKLGPKLGATPASEMFTFGLLSHIGELGLASVYPEEYGHLVANVTTTTKRGYLEDKAFGITSEDMSVAMLEDWGFPKLFTDTLLSQELLPMDKDSRSGRIRNCLLLAERIVEVMVDKKDMHVGLAAALSVAKDLGLDANQLAEMSEEMQREWASWNQMFEMAARPLNAITEIEMGKAAQGCPKLSILLATEDAQMRSRIQRQVDMLGHTLVHASNWSECVHHAQGGSEILIVDSSMTEVDGFTLVSTMRVTQACDDAYIIMLLDPEKDGDIDARVTRSFEAGADDFIKKSIEDDTLRSRLSSCSRAYIKQHKLAEERNRLRDDYEELSASHLEALEAAMTDPLTKLYNRRHAGQRLAELWSHTGRMGGHLSVIAVDIDYFKRVNDQYGHSAGDEILRSFAQILRNHSRLPDLACRLGGEEFLLVLPDTGARGAAQHAERVRLACEKTAFELAGRKISITASFGVAEKAPGMKNFEELIDAADRALMHSKRNGRNKVSVFHAEALEREALA